MEPSYIQLFHSGELGKRVAAAQKLMHCCTVCPQNCRVDRIGGSLGICGIGALAPVSSYGPHFGEERPLVGSNGSGTIFFASCNLLCIFCQNYEISHFNESEARHLSGEELAAVMVDLQHQGCHNIHLVTHTHVVPHILSALPEAIKQGLKLPLVYNSSGYDAVETLDLLDGVIDIYMPDFKFWHNETGKAFTKAGNYADIAREAIKTMHRQVGDLVVDDNGIAVRGLIVRHLVMPDQVEESAMILKFLAEEISPRCNVNIMDQYRPCWAATPPIDRPLSGREYEQAQAHAKENGLVQLNEHRLADLLKNLGIL